MRTWKVADSVTFLTKSDSRRLRVNLGSVDLSRRSQVHLLKRPTSKSNPKTTQKSSIIFTMKSTPAAEFLSSRVPRTCRSLELLFITPKRTFLLSTLLTLSALREWKTSSHENVFHPFAPRRFARSSLASVFHIVSACSIGGGNSFSRSTHTRDSLSNSDCPYRSHSPEFNFFFVPHTERFSAKAARSPPPPPQIARKIFQRFECIFKETNTDAWESLVNSRTHADEGRFDEEFFGKKKVFKLSGMSKGREKASRGRYFIEGLARSGLFSRSKR